MYGDDIVILAPSAAGLHHMIRRLESYCEDWNLKVKLSKSNAMVFRNGVKLGLIRWYKGERVEVVNQYKYLGVILTTSLSFNIHLRKVQGHKISNKFNVEKPHCLLVIKFH